MQKTAVPAPRTAGNEATTLLKPIALIFMFCDHAGKMLLPGVPEMRMLGRIAFPIYCWCAAVGCTYSSSIPKYALRVLIMGLISQPLYNLALNHTWAQPNVFLTLCLGILGVWGLREKKAFSHVWGPLAVLLIAAASGTDYGWKGVLLVMLLYACRQRRGAIAALMIAFCMYWGSTSSAVTVVCGTVLNFSFFEPMQTLLSPWLKLQALAILSLPLILWHCPVRLKLPRWIMYLVYPGHLVILYILEKLMGVV